MQGFDIRVGDFVQARKGDGNEGAIAVTEFIATGVDGDVISGSPIGPVSESDGWSVELIGRGDPGLPVSEINDLAAWLRSTAPGAVRIVGPFAGNWQRASDGARVDVSDVLDWVPWADYVPPVEPEPEPEGEGSVPPSTP